MKPAPFGLRTACRGPKHRQGCVPHAAWSRTRLAAIGLFIALVVTALPAAAAPVDRGCGTPQQADDGWNIEANARLAGFDAGLLCEAAQDFFRSPRNLHGFVVERHGRLVLDSYRAGPDRSTYALWASRTAFDKDTRHDVRSVTKSVVALLWGIAESEGAVPPLSTPVLDLLPALADLRHGGRERITVADMLCMRSGLAWDESGSYSRWDNDEKGLLWRGDRARYVFDRPISTSPGAHFNYNGGLTAVLGLLLEERTGQDLAEFARQRLFDPLGLQEWEWVGDLRGRTRAYTGRAWCRAISHASGGSCLPGAAGKAGSWCRRPGSAPCSRRARPAAGMATIGGTAACRYAASGSGGTPPWGTAGNACSWSRAWTWSWC